MKYFLSLFFLANLYSCSQNSSENRNNIQPSFYYWKTVVNPSSGEKKLLHDLQVKKIYVKFFDVEWNEKKNAPTPTAQLLPTDTSFLRAYDIVPTVFITNECIYKMDSSQVETVAEKIYKLVKNIGSAWTGSAFKEIQIDCDWTVTTREKYFRLLSALKKIDSNQVYSVTIRLHQIKYPEKTGIPPVDRGMLMCYNMGNLREASTENSILELDELKKYVSNLQQYPLILDVALPLFDWFVLFRKGQFSGLLQNVPLDFFQNEKFDLSGHIFTCKEDTIMEGYTFLKGDMIRQENPTYKEIVDAADLIRKEKKDTAYTVSLYDLDSLSLNKFSKDEIENIFQRFY